MSKDTTTTTITAITTTPYGTEKEETLFVKTTGEGIGKSPSILVVGQDKELVDEHFNVVKEALLKHMGVGAPTPKDLKWWDSTTIDLFLKNKWTTDIDPTGCYFQRPSTFAACDAIDHMWMKPSEIGFLSKHTPKTGLGATSMARIINTCLERAGFQTWVRGKWEHAYKADKWAYSPNGVTLRWFFPFVECVLREGLDRETGRLISRNGR